MNYESKYLKYKYKYLELKKRNGGKGGEPLPIPPQPAWTKDYLFHGTSSIYLPYIRRDGMGPLPDEIYDRVKFIVDFNYLNYPGDPITFLGTGRWKSILSSRKETDEAKKHANYFAADVNFTSHYGSEKSLGLGESHFAFMSGLMGWMRHYEKIDKTHYIYELWAPAYEVARELVDLLIIPEKKHIILAIKISDKLEGYNPEWDGWWTTRDIKPEELFIYNPYTFTLSPLIGPEEPAKEVKKDVKPVLKKCICNPDELAGGKPCDCKL